MLKYYDATGNFSNPLSSSNLSTKDTLNDNDEIVLVGGGSTSISKLANKITSSSVEIITPFDLSLRLDQGYAEVSGSRIPAVRSIYVGDYSKAVLPGSVFYLEIEDLYINYRLVTARAYTTMAETADISLTCGFLSIDYSTPSSLRNNTTWIGASNTLLNNLHYFNDRYGYSEAWQVISGTYEYPETITTQATIMSIPSTPQQFVISTYFWCNSTYFYLGDKNNVIDPEFIHGIRGKIHTFISPSADILANAS